MKYLKLNFYFLFFLTFQSFAQIPQGYYSNAEGKIKAELKTALYTIIKSGHTYVDYGSLWTYFQKTDKKPNGNLWDMYSSCTFVFVTNQCGNYNAECDCYNREHTVPLSWMGGNIYPMYADLHHIVPVDAWTNNKRGNYPIGKVGTASWSSSNNSKLGTNSISGYNGTAFEPVDEYKGDFARMIFYMVTRYEDLVSAWINNDNNAAAVLNGTTWPAFKDWAKNLYLQWNEQDPPSAKEISRNDSIFKIQHNRNPFIDHPEYARQIWGADASIEEPVFFCKLFPNPVTTGLQFDSSTPLKEACVSDISGRLLARFYFSVQSSTISLESFAQGIYFISVTDIHNKNTCLKVVKE